MTVAALVEPLGDMNALPSPESLTYAVRSPGAPAPEALHRWTNNRAT
jgi:hypothetical protein